MAAITAGESLTVHLNPNEVLTVATAADSTANVTWLGNTPGSAPQSVTGMVASTTSTFGPYNYSTRWHIVGLTGSVTFSTALAQVAQGKSTYGLDLYGAINTPTVADIQFSNSQVFVALTTAITANVTTTSAPAGSIAITSHATGVGKLFMSDGSKWQYAIVA